MVLCACRGTRRLPSLALATFIAAAPAMATSLHVLICLRPSQVGARISAVGRKGAAAMSGWHPLLTFSDWEITLGNSRSKTDDIDLGLITLGIAFTIAE